VCAWEGEKEKEKEKEKERKRSVFPGALSKRAMFSYQDKLHHTCVVCPAVKTTLC
jgi:hypothetical protein